MASIKNPERGDNYSGGLLASSVDQAGYSDSWTYDSSLNKITHTDKRGKVWHCTYNSTGDVLTETNPLSQVTTMATQGCSCWGIAIYDPSTGRFLTRDPVQDGRNWYAYCENNPLKSVDANGLKIKISPLFSAKDQLKIQSGLKHIGQSKNGRSLLAEIDHIDITIVPRGPRKPICEMNGNQGTIDYDPNDFFGFITDPGSGILGTNIGIGDGDRILAHELGHFTGQTDPPDRQQNEPGGNVLLWENPIADDWGQVARRQYKPIWLLRRTHD